MKQYLISDSDLWSMPQCFFLHTGRIPTQEWDRDSDSIFLTVHSKILYCTLYLVEEYRYTYCSKICKQQEKWSTRAVRLVLSIHHGGGLWQCTGHHQVNLQCAQNTHRQIYCAHLNLLFKHRAVCLVNLAGNLRQILRLLIRINPRFWTIFWTLIKCLTQKSRTFPQKVTWPRNFFFAVFRFFPSRK
jgi:hypothetical protein